MSLSAPWFRLVQIGVLLLTLAAPVLPDAQGVPTVQAAPLRREQPAAVAGERLASSAGAQIDAVADRSAAVLSNQWIQYQVGLRDGRGFALGALTSANGVEFVDQLQPVGELQLEFTDSSGRAFSEAALRYVGHDARALPDGSVELTVLLRDPVLQLAVSRRYRLWPQAAAVERSTLLQNQGTNPVVLRRLAPLRHSFIAGQGQGWRATVAAANAGVTEQPLGDGQSLHIQAPPLGGAPEEMVPAVILTQTGAGGGVFAGLRWSTNYHLDVGGEPGGVATVTGGELVSDLTLGPGERLEAPATFVGVFDGSVGDGTRALQRFSEVQAAAARPVNPFAAAPIVWNSWYAYDRNLDERVLLPEVDAAAALGIEVFAIDHGWERQIGDWRAQPDRFTSGSLASRSRYVHAHGLRFGLWIAFGVADPRSPVAVAHPDWLAAPPAPPAAQPIDGARLLCLAKAHDWVLADLERAITEYQVDWLKFDQAMIGSCTPAGAPPAAVAASLRANTAAFYDILETLRARHPLLMLENCFNGAGYLDYAVQERTDVAWLTDNVGAPDVPVWSLQRAFAGASRAMPARYLEMWLAQLPGEDLAALDYRALSTMGGAWGVSLRLSGLAEAQRNALQQLIARYRRLRPFIVGGDLYHLSDPTSGEPLILAYVMPGGRQAAVLAVRNDARDAPPAAQRLAAPGLLLAARYAVSVDPGGSGAASVSMPDGQRGDALMDGALSVSLAGQSGAVLYLTAAD